MCRAGTGSKECCPGPFPVLLARKGTAPRLEERGEAGLVTSLLSWLIQVPTYLPPRLLKPTQLEFYLRASFVSSV